MALLSGLGSGFAMSCGVGHGHGSDPNLLWLWYRLPAVAPIGPLAWESPCARDMALKRKKKNKKKQKKPPHYFHDSFLISKKFLEF